MLKPKQKWSTMNPWTGTTAYLMGELISKITGYSKRSVYDRMRLKWLSLRNLDDCAFYIKSIRS